MAWAAGVMAVVVKVEVARVPGEPVRAAAAVTALVGRAAALSVKEAAVARARAKGGAALVVAVVAEGQQ